jgi:SAM-dependent methyltransferase
VNSHDLFIYTEDDMAVTEEHIRNFLRITPQLRSDEIIGYLRYEVDAAGSWSLPDFHGPFHWKPDSVRQRGKAMFAEFTNEHAGFYLLTQGQLKKIIASGGFLRAPYQGRYGLPETAATDPYTQCGFHKVICISSPKDFLIHHLPNRYVGKMGIPFAVFEEQIEILKYIHRREHPALTLCPVESQSIDRRWNKCYDERPHPAVLSRIPEQVATVLSFGSGSGAVEKMLQQRGVKVTVVPLDSVVGGQTERCGIETIYGKADTYFAMLSGRIFDCIILTNLLHLLPHPYTIIHQLAQLLSSRGTLIIVGYNFNTIPIWTKRLLRIKDYHKLSSYGKSGIHAIGPNTLRRNLRKHGLNFSELQYISSGEQASHSSTRLDRIRAPFWIIKAARSKPTDSMLDHRAEPNRRTI